ncbi:MAG: mannitol dehydrogenase family protein [Roseateles sp.]|uniref:mannitol dehydrogenase family protein n=1 Tax=Roseateles sp. TaxID=1971397 RepID=UPI0040352C23
MLALPVCPTLSAAELQDTIGPRRAPLLLRPRLSPALLGRLPAGVARPRFDVHALRTGILHLGCGVFHRAHQAVLTQRAIEAGMTAGRLPPWGIVAASLRTGSALPALKQQQGLYTVLVRGPQGLRAEVVGSLREALHAQWDAARLQQVLLDPQLRLVTLTVTEAGYCLDPGSGRLDWQDAAVRADCHRPWPCTMPGLLVRGLAMRRMAGLAPPVLISCDNMPANGRQLRQICMDMAALQDDGLADWIGRNVQFPSSMVDRIVPATTEADRRCADALLGLTDAVPVSTEPFSQWVIEHFEGPRPLWEAAGAVFVDDVAPWEAAKLRLLNGGHLALACLGLLAGCATVAEVMAEPLMRRYALRLLIDEQQPTLPPGGPNISAYAHELVERWSNPRIAHHLERVGRNASGKLAARLLAGLRLNLASSRPAPLTLLAVAAWMRCASGHDPQGSALLRSDSLGDTLCRVGREAGDDAARLVDGLLSLREIFGDDLQRQPLVVAGLREGVRRLQCDGAVAAVGAALAHAHRRRTELTPCP